MPQELQARQTNVQQALTQIERQDQRLLEAYLAAVVELAEFERLPLALRGAAVFLLCTLVPAWYVVKARDLDVFEIQRAEHFACLRQSGTRSWPVAVEQRVRIREIPRRIPCGFRWAKEYDVCSANKICTIRLLLSNLYLRTAARTPRFH